MNINTDIVSRNIKWGFIKLIFVGIFLLIFGIFFGIYIGYKFLPQNSEISTFNYSPKEEKIIKYNAHVEEVYDGDTYTVDIYLGFGVVLNDQKVRLIGIDTPELRGKEKTEATRIRDIVRNDLLDKDIKIIEYGKGKYGRWLVTVLYNDVNYNEYLLEKKLAKIYK